MLREHLPKARIRRETKATAHKGPTHSELTLYGLDPFSYPLLPTKRPKSTQKWKDELDLIKTPDFYPWAVINLGHLTSPGVRLLTYR